MAWLLAALVLAACGDDDGAHGDGGLDGRIGSADGATGPDAGTPTTLSREGLYSDIATKTIAASMTEYQPAHALWSDGADKRRWFALPPGAKIDTSDMDHWVFPNGTRFFKEFGFAGKRIETRLILKIADNDFLMGAFLWRDDQSDADWQPGGMVVTVTGPAGPTQQYTVPNQIQCLTCHRGEPGRILGFSAIQLSKTGGTGPNLKQLASAGTLTNPPPGGIDYPVPGNAIQVAALGALHANCGHCHNPNQTVFAQTNQWLQLRTADRTAETTSTWTTTVKQELGEWNAQPGHMRIQPMAPATSGIIERMSVRGNMDQMPPRPFSRVVDQPDLDAVTAWVNSLTP